MKHLISAIGILLFSANTFALNLEDVPKKISGQAIVSHSDWDEEQEGPCELKVWSDTFVGNTTYTIKLWTLDDSTLRPTMLILQGNDFEAVFVTGEAFLTDDYEIWGREGVSFSVGYDDESGLNFLDYSSTNENDVDDSTEVARIFVNENFDPVFYQSKRVYNYHPGGRDSRTDTETQTVDCSLLN